MDCGPAATASPTPACRRRIRDKRACRAGLRRPRRAARRRRSPARARGRSAGANAPWSQCPWWRTRPSARWGCRAAVRANGRPRSRLPPRRLGPRAFRGHGDEGDEPRIVAAMRARHASVSSTGDNRPVLMARAASAIEGTLRSEVIRGDGNDRSGRRRNAARTHARLHVLRGARSPRASPVPALPSPGSRRAPARRRARPRSEALWAPLVSCVPSAAHAVPCASARTRPARRVAG